MEEISDPKANALERVLPTVPNGKFTASVQMESFAAVDAQKVSGEAKVEGYVSVGARIVRSLEDLTKLVPCNDFAEDIELFDSGPMQLQAESSIGISMIPKKVTTSHTHDHESGSEMVSNEVMQENHVIATENTYQKSEFDRINMEQKESIPEEVIHKSFMESSTSSIDIQLNNHNSYQSGLPPENAATDCMQVQLGHRSDDAIKNSGLEELVIGQKKVSKSPIQLVDMGKRGRGRPRKVQTGLEQLVLGQKTAAKSSSQLGDTGKRSRGRPKKVQNSPTSFLENINMEQKETMPEQVTQNSFLESLTIPIDSQSRTYNSDQSGLPTENAANDCKHIQFGHQSDDATKISGLEELVIGQDTVFKSPSQLVDAGKRGRGRPRKVQTGLEQLGPVKETAAKSSSQLEDTGKRSRGRPRKVQDSPTSLGCNVKVLPEKGKDSQEFCVNSSRSLRSRSQEKSIEHNFSNTVEEGGDREKPRKKRKTRMEENRVDEFGRIRTHLRYLLHRIKYEKNFLDAYSGEGWKGQSLDKIKPEKELKRAKAEIFGRKLKIRDLFQRLDLARSKGRLPEILFDSRGEIDSEDIFCAKCGSKDVTLSNDIILCDGACDRGFHQFCLDPPLLKEYIPSDDEGWLCPGCECKIDCIKLLNDSQETNIQLGDSWEKVFAEEAAAAVSGKNLDDNSGLPSDDSEDDDYDPGGPDLDEKVQGDDSSTDESDYLSESDNMQVLPQKNSCGLPPDDSEDDEYDPSALVIDQMFKDSSCSDFTSDSEDFTGVIDDCEDTGKAQGQLASTPDHVKNNEEGCGHPEQCDTAPLYPRRQVESLDYKKLHDEEYGNTSSDSSDEDYMATSSPDKNNSDKEATATEHGKESGDLELDQKVSESTHNRRYVKKFAVEGTDSLLSRSCEDSAVPVASSKSTSRALYGEHATQRLLQSFKENQYPKRAVKESLAAELALSVRQVSNWFNNRRWSFRHSSSFGSSVAEFKSNEGTPLQRSIDMSGSSLNTVLDNATCSEIEKKEQDMGSLGLTEGCDTYMTPKVRSITKTWEERTKVSSDATAEPTISLETPKLNLEDGSANPESGEK
ncbi:pathogenesis-related homeodomain protein-like isoform X1 [Apium graveolens]|uniref:pathogenesis-related homeodomain protein-like isoform X1 n=2 Tax=Apium graveolens TaxID=4045 RepID=UPI003D7BCDA8